jgi:WhiB family redox-sensing transcriptional regulator
VRDDHWTNYGACLGMSTELFFPIGETASGQAELAKGICRRCPVREECLQDALDNRIKHGIWGGTTEGEREKLTRRARRANAA